MKSNLDFAVHCCCLAFVLGIGSHIAQAGYVLCSPGWTEIPDLSLSLPPKFRDCKWVTSCPVLLLDVFHMIAIKPSLILSNEGFQMLSSMSV